MAFDVSALSNYTRDNADRLIAKSYFGSKAYNLLTAKGANVQTGIKTSENIHLIDEEIIFQSDSGCGFNASGGSTISKRVITVGAIKVNKTYCPTDLRPKYTQVLLNPGSMKEKDASTELARILTENNAAAIAEKMETAWFQGDTTLVDVNLNKFDGLLKQCTVANGAVDANTSTYNVNGATNSTSFTSAATSGSGATRNMSDAVNAVWRAFPAGVKGKSDAVILMGTDLFDLYILSEITANRYHYVPGTTATYEYTIPGTGYTIYGLEGMSGSNKILGLRASNVYFGVDLEHEDEQFEMVYNEDDELTRFKARFKAGINVAYPDEVVNYTLK